jgi:hypothetical protein
VITTYSEASGILTYGWEKRRAGWVSETIDSRCFKLIFSIFLKINVSSLAVYP